MPQRSGIVQPDVGTNAAPNPVFSYGEALVTGGLENAKSMTNGMGVVTRGLLWQLYDVWFDSQFYDGISSVWANDNAAITTNWTDSNSAITTTWTPTQYGVFGEYTP